MKRCFLFFLILLLLTACGSPEASVSPTPAPAPTATPEPRFESGITEGNIYRNDYLSLSFTLPENWTFATSEQFQELLGIGTEQLRDNMELDAAPDGSTFYEFYAQGSQGESVIMTVEDLSLHDGGKLLSVQDFIDTLSAQYKAITTVEYIVGDSFEQILAGHSSIILPLSVEDAGVEQHNCVFRSGDYMVTITFSARTEDELFSLEKQLKEN